MNKVQIIRLFDEAPDISNDSNRNASEQETKKVLSLTLMIRKYLIKYFKKRRAGRRLIFENGSFLNLHYNFLPVLYRGRGML